MANSANDTTVQLDALVELLDPILRHINVHRFLWGFTVICALVAWNRGLMLLYGLVAFLLATLAVCHFFRWFNLRGLSMRAGFAEAEIFAEQTATVNLYFRSRNSQHFVHVNLPIERKPQQRLNEEVISGDVVQSCQSFILYSKGARDFKMTMRLPRGVYSLQSAVLRSSYPLGILSTQMQATFDAELLYVLPVWFSIAELPVASALHKNKDELKSSARGGHDEFADIRPYRRGDAFKTVHWGASARQVSRGKDWMVKEFTSMDTPRLLIMLNPFEITEVSAFDKMISLALSMGLSFAKCGYQVSLLGYDTFSDSANDFWQLDITAHLSGDTLRKLAEIEALRQSRFSAEAAHHAMLSHLPDANVIVSFATQTPAKPSWLALLANKTHYGVRLYAGVRDDSGRYHRLNERSHEYHINVNTTLTDIEALFQQQNATAR